MSMYQHILLATDFSEHGETVAQKAQQLAELHQAKLSVLHVIEDLPVSDTIYGSPVAFSDDLMEQLVELSKQRMTKLAAVLGLDAEQCYLEIGSPKMEIVRVAEEHQADLIVVGSHGRHGLALLLGSTANGVLHHAKCDVLAVRLQDD